MQCHVRHLCIQFYLNRCSKEEKQIEKTHAKILRGICEKCWHCFATRLALQHVDSYSPERFIAIWGIWDGFGIYAIKQPIKHFLLTLCVSFFFSKYTACDLRSFQLMISIASRHYILSLYNCWIVWIFFEENPINSEICTNFSNDWTSLTKFIWFIKI